MSSCFSRCLRVPIAMLRFYEQSLWIPQKFLFTNPDLHHGLLGQSYAQPQLEVSIPIDFPPTKMTAPPRWRRKLVRVEKRKRHPARSSETCCSSRCAH